MDVTLESVRAFDDLEATFPSVIRGLENGLLEARLYFDLKSLSFDGSVFSAIVRLHAREYLKARRLNAADIEVERVSLCGLWLKVGRHHLKIWKISETDLSRALQRQVSSGQQLTLVDRDNGIPIVTNLAIFWTSDRTYQLGQLYLVQPKEDDPRCFDWAWSREIPLTLAAVEAVSAGDIQVEDAVVEEDRQSGR